MVRMSTRTLIATALVTVRSTLRIRNAVKERKVKVTSPNLIRGAGLSAVVGGGLFVLMQLLHPADLLPSVTTTNWATVHYLGVAMCLFSLLGIAGIYARQVE